MISLCKFPSKYNIKFLFIYFDVYNLIFTLNILIYIKKYFNINLYLSLNVSSDKVIIPKAVICAGRIIRRRVRRMKYSDIDAQAYQQVMKQKFECKISSVLEEMKKHNLHIFILGYGDKSALGFDFSDYGLITRLEAPLFGYSSGSNSVFFGYLVDHRAPYFDGRLPTDLEKMILDPRATASSEEIELVKLISDSKIQKYMDLKAVFDSELKSTDLVIVGQVRGDAAYLETENLCQSNVDLVNQSMKAIKADRYFYKGHPRNRFNKDDLKELAGIDNLTIIPEDVSFASLLHGKPMIAVMTSGAGLEAAVRGCQVYCFGISFYSNWGFTTDMLECARRTMVFDAVTFMALFICRYTKYAKRKDLKHVSAKDAMTSYLAQIRS